MTNLHSEVKLNFIRGSQVALALHDLNFIQFIDKDIFCFNDITRRKHSKVRSLVRKMKLIRKP